MRIEWSIVMNTDISVLAQQWESEKGTPSFRPWNPNYINDEHVPTPDVSCPMYCICCFIVECCFKNVFREHVDELRTGLYSA